MLHRTGFQPDSALIRFGTVFLILVLVLFILLMASNAW